MDAELDRWVRSHARRAHISVAGGTGNLARDLAHLRHEGRKRMLPDSTLSPWPVMLGVGGLAALAAGVWWLRKKQPAPAQDKKWSLLELHDFGMAALA